MRRLSPTVIAVSGAFILLLFIFRISSNNMTAYALRFLRQSQDPPFHLLNDLFNKTLGVRASTVPRSAHGISM